MAWRDTKKGFRSKGGHKGFSSKGKSSLKKVKVPKLGKSSFPSAGPRPRSDSVGVPTNVWRKPIRKGFHSRGK